MWSWIYEIIGQNLSKNECDLAYNCKNICGNISAWLYRVDYLREKYTK